MRQLAGTKQGTGGLTPLRSPDPFLAAGSTNLPPQLIQYSRLLRDLYSFVSNVVKPSDFAFDTVENKSFFPA